MIEVPNFNNDIEFKGTHRNNSFDDFKMDLRRYHFFCPTLKGEQSSQTLLSADDEASEEDLESKIYEGTIESILLGNQNFQTDLQRNIQQEYMQSIGFLHAVYNDERFDLLKPPPTMIEDLHPSFHFQFCLDQITVTSTATNETKTFSYNKTSKEMFYSLELGQVSSVLCSLFASFGSSQLTGGQILVHITDNRLSPPRNYITSLTITYDVIHSISETKQLKGENNHKYQKDALLLAHPYICVDPSPDVARAQSIYDSRKKMWTSEKDETTFVPSTQNVVINKVPEQVSKKHSITKISLHQSIRGVKIAPLIVDLFSSQK